MLLQSMLPAFPVCSNDEAVEVVLAGDQAKAEDGLLQVIRRTTTGSAASRWDASYARPRSEAWTRTARRSSTPARWRPAWRTKVNSQFSSDQHFSSQPGSLQCKETKFRW